jgi:hypothetical protein
MKNKKASRSSGASSGFCQGAGEAFAKLLQELAPPVEARKHFENARLELLKGLRAVLDSRIERRSKPKTRGQSIRVE